MTFNSRSEFSSLRSSIQQNLDTDNANATYDLVWTLRNLVIHGGENGRQAVLTATTDDLREILPHLGNSVRKFFGDAMGMETERMIAKTWL